MKPLDLVQVRPEYRQSYSSILDDPTDRFVYLGDIGQMPGHGVFVRMGVGKVFTGLHTSSFEVINDETEVATVEL
jgi:hypothetical protein